MKLSRFLLSIFIVTYFSFLYVWQQIRLVEISYQVDKNWQDLTQLLDQKEQLMYNVGALKSPANLEKCLVVKNGQFATPTQWRVVRLIETQPEELAANKGPTTRPGMLSFLSFSREAEAGQP